MDPNAVCQYQDEAFRKEIQRLKNEQRYDAALEILYRQIEPTNRYWKNVYPYQQIAIILRKQKRYAEEVAIIERYVSLWHTKLDAHMGGRLKKACELAGEETSDFDERKCFLRRGLVVDVETTGLSRAEDEIIEVASILFRYSILSNRIIAVEEEYSGLREPSVAISPAASRVNHLSIADVRGKNIDSQSVRMLVEKADFIVAHNTSFDGWFLSALLPFVTDGEKPWYCSMRGIDWEERGCKSKKLDHILAEYQIRRDRSHRALDDARGLLDLLSKTDDTDDGFLLGTLFRSSPVYEFKKSEREAPQMQIVDINTLLSPVQVQFTATNHELPASGPIDVPRKRSLLDRLLGR